MVEGDYATLVKTRPVGQWKETLAVLATYTGEAAARGRGRAGGRVPHVGEPWAAQHAAPPPHCACFRCSLAPHAPAARPLLHPLPGADQWASLCDALAARLAQTGMHHAASLCYVCAGNVDQAVLYWSKAVKASGAKGAVPVDTLQVWAPILAPPVPAPHSPIPQHPPPGRLCWVSPPPAISPPPPRQAVIEKSVVLGMATNSSAGASPALADLVTQYASILSTQGRMGAALRWAGVG
jgi:hypothetical protein